MTDSTTTKRLTEIRERLKVAVPHPFDQVELDANFALIEWDVPFLLSLIEKKDEEIAMLLKFTDHYTKREETIAMPDRLPTVAELQRTLEICRNFAPSHIELVTPGVAPPAEEFILHAEEVLPLYARHLLRLRELLREYPPVCPECEKAFNDCGAG